MAKKRKGNKFKHFLAFIIFLALGIASGYVGATHFFSSSSVDEDVAIANEFPKDITDSKEYSDEIEQFSSFLSSNVYLYNSNGINVDSIDNSIKLKLAYEYAINNQLFTTEQIDAYWYGSTTCTNDFLVDTLEDGVTNASYCTLKVINKGNLLKSLNNYFKTDVIEYPSEFYPTNSAKCLLYEDDSYRCGKVTETVVSTGEIVNKFEVEKVTIDADNTIYYYDRGYLLDNRSGIEKNPNYEKAYLHSYDSTEYYYELKSSDNLTFKHVFKVDEDGNYYYYGSSVEEK